MTHTDRTGIEIIDSEHARLMDLEAQLTRFCTTAEASCKDCTAEMRADCDRTLSEHFGELLTYMVEHFRHEEQLMDCLPHADAQAHKYEHAAISDLFVKLAQSKLRSEMLTTPQELRSIVRTWLVEHIANWDFPLAEKLGGRPPVTQTS